MGKIKTERILGIYTEQNVSAGEMLCRNCMQPAHWQNLLQKEILVGCNDNNLFFCNKCGRQFNKGGRSIIGELSKAGVSFCESIFEGGFNRAMYVKGLSEMNKKQANAVKQNMEEIIACLSIERQISRHSVEKAFEKID